ncbi:Haloalkane dehalogenase [Streptomyces alboniger]
MLRHRAIAMDTVGYGASAKPGPHSVERFADGVGDLVEALGLDRFHLVGHHTGGVIAVEVAARFQDRVASLMLSATAFVDDEKRGGGGGHGRVDHVDAKPDGSHLRELWDRRRGFYQPGEEAALTRYVIDALTVLDRVEEGRESLRRYAMEPRLPHITARTSPSAHRTTTSRSPPWRSSRPRSVARRGCCPTGMWRRRNRLPESCAASSPSGPSVLRRKPGGCAMPERRLPSRRNAYDNERERPPAISGAMGIRRSRQRQCIDGVGLDELGQALVQLIDLPHELFDTLREQLRRRSAGRDRRSSREGRGRSPSPHVQMSTRTQGRAAPRCEH